MRGIIKLFIPAFAIINSVLFNQPGKPACIFRVIFGAENLPIGVYVCSIKVNDFFKVRKMLLMNNFFYL